MTVDIFYSHVESRKNVLSTVSRTKLSTVTLKWIATFSDFVSKMACTICDMAKVVAINNAAKAKLYLVAEVRVV